MSARHASTQPCQHPLHASTLCTPALTVDMPAHFHTQSASPCCEHCRNCCMRHASTPSRQHLVNASADCRHASTPPHSSQALAADTAGPHACMHAMPAQNPASTYCHVYGRHASTLPHTKSASPCCRHCRNPCMLHASTPSCQHPWNASNDWENASTPSHCCRTLQVAEDSQQSAVLPCQRTQ
jgi:hypothetical protein